MIQGLVKERNQKEEGNFLISLLKFESSRFLKKAIRDKRRILVSIFLPLRVVCVEFCFHSFRSGKPWGHKSEAKRKVGKPPFRNHLARKWMKNGEIVWNSCSEIWIWNGKWIIVCGEIVRKMFGPFGCQPPPLCFHVDFLNETAPIPWFFTGTEPMGSRPTSRYLWVDDETSDSSNGGMFYRLFPGG